MIVRSKLKVINDIDHFFKNGIGAIDDIHISFIVSPAEQARFIGRKGIPTQNIMVVCDWNIASLLY